MGNYENLKQSITEVIRTNGNQEITGAVLQSTLLTIISTVGANATFAGIAIPSTNPGTPDGSVFYLASESGAYSNFGSIVLQDGLSILMWNGSWRSQQILSIDDVPTAGSDNLVKSGGVYNNISNLNYLEGKTSYSVYSENGYINPYGQVISGGDGKITSSIILPSGATITAICRGTLTNVAIISEVIEEGVQYKVLVRSEDSSIHAYSYTNYDVNDKNISVSYVGSSDSLVLFLENTKERRGCFTKNFISIETPTRYADGIVKAEAYATSEFLESIGTTSLKIFTGYYQSNGRFYLQLKKGSHLYIDENVIVGNTAPTGLFEMFAKDADNRYVIHLIVDCNIISSLVETGLLLHFADMSFFEKSESGAIQNIQNTKTIESALELSDFKQALSPIIVDDIAYINPGGIVISGGDGFYTEPIILPSKYTIVVKAKSLLRNITIISEVITEGSQYNPLVRGIDTTIREYSYTNNTNSDLQIALSGLREAGLSAYTVVNIKKLEEAAKATPTIAFDRTLQYPLINPINETMDMLGIVKDWGFIGDSLNSGEIYYKRTSDNVTISGDMYAWSWGQNICQLCRTIGTNFSVGGLTAKSWINMYWNTSANGYKTGGGGETFNANPKQVYTICLGTNDINAMIKSSMDAKARAAYIGSWDDVDLNDFNNNADTFYGNYSGIIQRIKSIQPSAKIFLINIFSIFHRSDIRFEINAAISDIHSHFANTFLIDLETLVPVSEAIIEKYGNGHFKVQGYMWFSYVIGNIINKIIRDNISAFDSLPFIGIEGKDDGTL